MPQLDILSFPSQIFWLCVVFLIGLFFSLKFILPDLLSIIHGRKFLSECNFEPKGLEVDFGIVVVRGFASKFVSSIDTFCTQIENKESFDLKTLEPLLLKPAKFYLSPFFFFYATDTCVLLLAFLISFSLLFTYVYYNFSIKTPKETYIQPYSTIIKNLNKKNTISKKLKNLFD